MVQGDIVQIVPGRHRWGGCLAIVDEVTEWGCRAYVEMPMRGAAYISLEKGEYVVVGKSQYIRSGKNSDVFVEDGL